MILEKIQNWLVRHRDQTNVTYSRFGRGDGEPDDRPPPTKIIVAPFDENAPEFMFLQHWHVQKMAVFNSCFGMAMVILFFISSFFEFNWYHHRRGVDISALLGLFVYLGIGVMIHYYVLSGVKKQEPSYLLPFIVVYSVICTGEVVTIFALLFKSLEPQETNQPPFFTMFVLVLVFAIVQLVMLHIVIECRKFLSMKKMHEFELKVAERSKASNPVMVIEFAKGDSGIENPNNETQTNNTIGIMNREVV
ncbi:unnamed protein product [Bursaphelenchus okinawaensis]|uniref:Uncharacterized protein n=1 Tax=Bursaphelenchus okinawaensis TaxID=465554 RepID=A0A811JTB6_9BILA|nr:unnamed protein product [Bursaphelenchus okinawaensis]CAG9082197.1 unnamed protein product [Bursaphelenchus okinawaensis]